MAKTLAKADFRSWPLAIFVAAVFAFLAVGAAHRLHHQSELFFHGERFVDVMILILAPLAIVVRLFQTYKAKQGKSA